MDTFNIDFDKIINNQFFEKLLKNDVGIYGKFIRNILTENKSLKDMQNSTINAYAKLIYKDIIERDLFSYIRKRTEIMSPVQSASSIIVIYEIDIKNIKFNLEIIYVRAIIEFKPIYFEAELQCIIDIDSLVITREGLTCIDLFGNPYIFSSILNNIKEKKFRFKNGIIRLSENDVKYINLLIKDGYKNTDSKIEELKENKIKCSICYDENDKSKLVKLKCGHVYHKSCIKESIDLFFKDPNKIYFKCPYCSEKYLETELL